jgi:hypothetical protein
MVAATARKKKGERGRPNKELTGNLTGRSPWTEDGRSRQISAAEELISGEVSTTVAPLEAPPVNSLNGEVEDVDGDLLSTSEEQGEHRTVGLGGELWLL